jgi:transcriptional regulator with XRE-family HTH domain
MKKITILLPINRSSMNEKAIQEVKDKIFKFLKEQRKSKGFTQTELAEKCGMTERSVQKIEAGEYLPNTEVLIKIAHVLDCEFIIRQK